MFTQCETYREQFVDIPRLMEDNVRYYKTPIAAYPSVTSVIGFITAHKFAAWRKSIGNEEANRKTKHATTRGTKLHRVFEVYLQNGDYQSLAEYKTPLIEMMFKAAKFYVDTRLDNIYQQETPMFSDKLCLAGTVDLICEVDGELAIVDFKTSAKEKPEEWLEDYFVQLSAYWAMFSEKTGIVPRKLVVFLVGENGDVQIVERKNIMHYLTTLQDYASKFIQHRDAQSR